MGERELDLVRLHRVAVDGDAGGVRSAVRHLDDHGLEHRAELRLQLGVLQIESDDTTHGQFPFRVDGGNLNSPRRHFQLSGTFFSPWELQRLCAYCRPTGSTTPGGQPGSVGGEASIRSGSGAPPGMSPLRPMVSSTIRRRSPSSLQATRTRSPAPRPKASSKLARMSQTVTSCPTLRGDQLPHGRGVDGGEQAEGVAVIGFGITLGIAAAVLRPFMPVEEATAAGHGGFEGLLGVAGDRRSGGRSPQSPSEEARRSAGADAAIDVGAGLRPQSVSVKFEASKRAFVWARHSGLRGLPSQKAGCQLIASTYSGLALALSGGAGSGLLASACLCGFHLAAAGLHPALGRVAPGISIR